MQERFGAWAAGVLTWAFFALLAGAGTALQAAPIPHLDQQVKITAREQPIDVFLKNLFGLLDLPVAVDPAVTGVVNASFDDQARQVLRNIRRSFGLVTYYDGAVVHVYPASSVSRRIFPVSAEVARRVLYSAKEMELTDRNNTLGTTPDGSLVVTGVGRFISLMEQLVSSARKAQAAQPPLGFEVFYLRYAWAQDVTVNAAGRELLVPGVASILRSLFMPYPQQEEAARTSRLLKRSQPRLRGQGLARIGRQERLGLPDDGETLEQAERGSAGRPGMGWLAELYDPALQPGVPNQVRIVADPRLNAVIVRDTFERIPHYRKLIESLDIEPQALEIEATIIDIDTNRARELGVNWRWTEKNDEVSFGRDATGPLPVPGVNTTGIGGSGGIISLVEGSKNQFMARIRALEVRGAAKIVSRPQVLTLSNVEATFDDSSTAYVRVAGEREVDLFNVTAGTTLRVTPHVFKPDGEEVSIKLLISVEDGKLDRGERVDDIPVVKSSTINTQALIREGESLLIGGLVREDTSDRVHQVPILGDIPLLGTLFRSKRAVTARIERMFLISPRIVPRDRLPLSPSSFTPDRSSAARQQDGGRAPRAGVEPAEEEALILYSEQPEGRSPLAGGHEGISRQESGHSPVQGSNQAERLLESLADTGD